MGNGALQMSILNVNDISNSGITFITSDMNAFYDQSLTQEKLDEMCDQLQTIFEKYNFKIEMAIENEQALRLQGRIMFKKLYESLDNMISEGN